MISNVYKIILPQILTGGSWMLTCSWQSCVGSEVVQWCKETVPAEEPCKCQPYYSKSIQALSSCKCSNKTLCFTSLCEHRHREWAQAQHREPSWPHFAVDPWCDLINSSRLAEQGNELSTLFSPVAISFWFLVLRKMPSAVSSLFRQLGESQLH